MDKNKTIAKYKSHTHREHIYKIPDTYIGSVEMSTGPSWKIDENRMVQSTLSHIPGLYKIVDEVIVNAWDQFIRYTDSKSKHKVTYISMSINKESGVVSVENDGKGIDVVVIPKQGIYAVEMIFGKLLTSTNYTENEERITGGKNGYGAKLANIFSQWFEVETVDTKEKKRFSQRWSNNMQVRHEPVITSVSAKEKEFTRVSFLPDFKRFGLSGWTEDMIDIFKRRAYEISACCGDKLKVTFNDEDVPVKRFKNFCELYFDEPNQIVYERGDKRWEIGIGVSDDFKQVSFVNGIYTSKGGKHVDYIVNIISKKMAEIILKKEKVNVKTSYIREHIFVFVNCIIVNPSFDSQTKDFLTTQVSKFGSSCKFTDKFFDNLIKIGLMERVLETYQFKESKLLKKTDGKKKNRIFGIPKLDDANEAGGKRSEDCTLILTEGDSAKAMAIAGLSVVGRDLYGVFPLRGKVINARAEAITQSGINKVMKNAELIHMKQILGLEQDAKYKDVSKLRYGHIMIMTDQDLDGSHIKGLLINWLDTFWPELLKIKGFVCCMQTPIVKMLQKKKEILFYSLRKYEEWKNKNPNYSKLGWKSKYYKGLGTSTTAEAKCYFKNMCKMEYIWDASAADTLDMAFNKDRSDDRKKWLGKRDEALVLEEEKKVPYSDFVNKELIHFSNYDLERSVPHIMDGFKPSQRKILFSCFKRKLKTEIRVAQLAGYVSEHSGYHHGEESLNGAIIAMAQNYAGSNNIHLLEPNGQFGTRLLGGKDAGSPRYLHTVLSDVTQKIFLPEDSPILEYLDDDGIRVEPRYYAPIIPFILCNGAQGIGTGYSTSIPPYNPKTIVKYMTNKLTNKEIPELIPYYHGFGGVTKVVDGQVFTKGRYEIINYKTILISELPINRWIDDYKKFLDEIVTEQNISAKERKEKEKLGLKLKSTSKSSEFIGVKSYKSQSTESRAHFEIEVDPNVLQNWLKTAASIQRRGEFSDNIEKKFRLTSKVSTSNMHLYSADTNTVKKYKTPDDIFEEFIVHRRKIYVDRKDYILKRLKIEMDILNEKVRFIQFVIDDVLDIRKHTKSELQEWLEQKDFKKDDNNSFSYLIGMPLYQMTKDMVEQLKKSFHDKKHEYDMVLEKTIEDMWLKDLSELDKEVDKHLLKSISIDDTVVKLSKKPRKTKPKTKK